MTDKSVHDATEEWVRHSITKEFAPIDINDVYKAFAAGAQWQSQQAQGEAVADGIEAAAAWVDARAYAYVEEHGSYDPDTGTTEFAGDGADYLLELEEIAEGIRSLAPPAPAAMPELTPEMIEAGANAVMITDSAAECAEKVYRAMRAVAPQPAEQQPECGCCGQTGVTALVEALEPFAKCARELDGSPEDGIDPAYDDEWAKFRLLVSDYRRARAALAAYRKQGGEQ